MSLLLKIGFITLAYQLLKSEKASRGIGIWKEELKLSADGVIMHVKTQENQKKYYEKNKTI